MYSKEEVIKANIELHTHLADKYKHEEPHYRPENIARIREEVISLRERTNGERLLDVGCGMGFMIDIAKDYFKIIRGIDATQAMLDRVDAKKSDCDIKVVLGKAEDMPFEDDYFDVCTAYAVLHHMHDVAPVFKSIFRVLKPGGIFYSDLDPNSHFWDAMKGLPEDGKYSGIVNRELNAVLRKDEELENELNVKKGILRVAEHLKHVEGGFSETRLLADLKSAGFSGVSIKYNWYLGEGKYIHSDKKAADAVRGYLNETLPLSKHLFKYIAVYAVK